MLACVIKKFDSFPNPFRPEQGLEAPGLESLAVMMIAGVILAVFISLIVGLIVWWRSL